MSPHYGGGDESAGGQDFFTHRGLALPTDQAERLAAGRRKRRIVAVPDPLRAAVAAFDASRTRAQDRARRASTRPRSDHTWKLP